MILVEKDGREVREITLLSSGKSEKLGGKEKLLRRDLTTK